MTETAATRPKLLTPPFARMWALTFITFLSAFQLFPTIPKRIIDLGGTESTAGMFLGVYTLAAALTAPLMGTIADHIGRRRLLMLAAGFFVIFSILYGVVTWFPLLLMVGLIHGILWAGLMASSGAVMTDILPESRRTEGLSYWGMATTCGIAIAPLIGLWLYEISWLSVCLTMSGLSIVMLFLASGVGTSEGSGEPFPKLTEIIDLRVLGVALSMTAVSFGYGGVTSFVAMLSEARGVRPASLYFTVFAAMILVSRLIVGPHADRLGPKRLLYPGWALAPVSLVLLAFATTRTEVVISALLFGFALGVGFPGFMSFVIGKTNPARRAATFGSTLMAFDFGIGVGSTVMGFVIEESGFTPAFLCGAVVSLLAIPVFIVGSRRLTASLEAPVA